MADLAVVLEQKLKAAELDELAVDEDTTWRKH
jgi:hypothetical protein